MRRLNFSLLKDGADGWGAAVLLMERFLEKPLKLPALEAQLPDGFDPQARLACHRYLLAALRFGGAVERGLTPFMKKKPSGLLRAALLVAGGEWVETVLAGGSPAPVVDHAVGRARKLLSKPEAGFLNALLRRLPEVLPVDAPVRMEERLAELRFPGWLLRRWEQAWGREGVQAYASWLSARSENYVYQPDGFPPAAAGLHPTPWGASWKRLPAGAIPRAVLEAVDEGRAYIKDPSTRLAPELLHVRPGDRVLDLCAAPGGKSFHLAYALEGEGRLVAVDLPGTRFQRLCGNLARLPESQVQPTLVAADILGELVEALEDAGAPVKYEAVLIDVPCSNTGVLRRRPDALWQLTEAGMARHPATQLALLTAASFRVAAGGRLVYSTCSVEADENEGVVRRFLGSAPGQSFRWIEGGVAFPPLAGHDGAGAFLLEKTLS